MQNRAQFSAPIGQTTSEEIANAITHGIGAVLSVAGLVFLLIQAIAVGDRWHIISVSIYGGSLVFLYLASTLYHSFQTPTLKRFFLILDHIGIFFLIAGTYTPILMVKMRDISGWSFLIILWSLAIIGACIKAFFTGRYTRISALIYIVMGWLVVFRIEAFLGVVEKDGAMLALAGGLFYTLGVIPFLWNRLPYNHAIWHLFVICGSFCHYLAILNYVILPLG
jgi:hemolysin III